MQHKNALLAILGMLTVVTAAASAATVDLAYSSYDVDQDGWQVRDTVNGVTSYFQPGWVSAGGVPTGHLEFADVTPGGYVFEAPTQFTGDFSAAFNNGGVSFDWMADMVQSGKRASVIFWSGTTRIWASSNPDPAPNVWHSFDFAFDTSVSWMVNYGSGGASQLATMNDLNSVLASVTGMDITGETWTGINETTWLDNPRIYMHVPAPGALALLGMASIIGTRRRRG
jgi:hypothetical protein